MQGDAEFPWQQKQ